MNANRRPRGAVAGIVVLSLAVLMAVPPNAAAAPKYSDWSTPVNMGSTINSGANDQGPALSKDGNSLYITSNRAGGQGDNDIWVSHWDDDSASWGAPVNLGDTVNQGGLDAAPCFSRDGHWMFFNSIRSGGYGDIDIWASYREDVHDDFSWETPVNLGSSVNTASQEAGPGYFANEDGDGAELYFASNRTGGLGGNDIYVAHQASDGSWGDVEHLTGLSSSLADNRPNVRFDGLEMVLTSGRSGGTGNLDIWVSTRNSTSDEWGTPVHVPSPLNSAQADSQAFISSDRETLIFASAKSGGSGGTDLYISTRTKANH